MNISTGENPPEAPARRRLRRVMGALVGLVVAGAVVLALVLGGGGSPRSRGTGQITRAAFVTMRQPGFRFALSLQGGVAGQPFSMTGGGWLQEPTGDGRLHGTALGRPIDEVLARRDAYMRTPLRADGQPLAPTPWIKFSVSQINQAMGGGGTLPGGNNPAQMLGLLRAAGVHRTVGRQTIRGVPTVHYQGLADLSRYASLVSSRARAAARANAALLARMTGHSTLPVNVWVDAQHRVRQIQIGISMCTKLGQLHEVINMDFFDYGPKPTVTVPPSREVTNVGARLGAATAQTLQALEC